MDCSVSAFFALYFCYRLLERNEQDISISRAEHKVIYAYEAGEELTVENARKHMSCHPRCRDKFSSNSNGHQHNGLYNDSEGVDFFLTSCCHVLPLIPVIAGLSYEVLRLSAKMKDNPLMNFLIMPGLLLQRLTAKEPDDKQIEVAITALKEVLKLEAENAA